MNKGFYLTTTLPYVNSKPHLGHALEFVQADVIARYQRLIGNEVFFNTGTDEHGVKVYRKAIEDEKDPQVYTDELVKTFITLKESLNLSWDRFIRTTDPEHKKAAQEFWRLCDKNGDIYKKIYKVKYCVGCELEKTDSELENGKCPIHPNLEIENIEEENYFFKFSKYQKLLLEFYKTNPSFVIPDSRFNEIRKFVEGGLQDFSISRLKEKMPWGVPVPGDDSQVMYVWFDALVNYISTLGWPFDKAQGKPSDDTQGKPLDTAQGKSFDTAQGRPNNFEKFWPGIQFAGKDNLRQQSAMWQAMLMSAGIDNSTNIIIHGFITSGGQKMSKSLGNVIDPLDIVSEYGTDALRYYLTREISTFEDGDFTMDKFKETYNANLANGLGNLVSRIMKMAETNLDKCPEIPEDTIPEDFKESLNNFEIQKAADVIWRHVGELDEKIQKTQPFKLIKEDKDGATKIIEELVVDLYTIGRMLDPIMPETSQKIKTFVKDNKMPIEPLFLRKE